MKKIVAVMLAFMLLLANAAFISAEELAAEIPETVFETETEAFVPELPQPNTPPPAGGRSCDAGLMQAA